MEYFMLYSKKDRGCPEAISAILYDRFYPVKDAEKVDIGRYSWYESVNPQDIRFSDGLCLIVRDSLWDFDIRRDGRFYIVSEEFLALLKEFGAPICTSSPVTACSRAGKPVGSRSAAIILPREARARHFLRE